MPAYFAMRIIMKKNTEGLLSAQSYYSQVFQIPLYAQFKTATEEILADRGYGECIP